MASANHVDVDQDSGENNHFCQLMSRAVISHLYRSRDLLAQIYLSVIEY